MASSAINLYGLKRGGLHTLPLQRAYGINYLSIYLSIYLSMASASQPAVKPSIERLALSMAMI